MVFSGKVSGAYTKGRTAKNKKRAVNENIAVRGIMSVILFPMVSCRNFEMKKGNTPTA